MMKQALKNVSTIATFMDQMFLLGILHSQNSTSVGSEYIIVRYFSPAIQTCGILFSLAHEIF